MKGVASWLVVCGVPIESMIFLTLCFLT